MVSEALVALTTQDEPTTPGVSWLPETVQVPEIFVHETEPVPEPPLAVRVIESPYEAEVLVTFNDDWFALLTVTVALSEETDV